MTGAYLRVKRNDEWQNIEVEYLTDSERKELFENRSVEELMRWLNLTCHQLVEIESFMVEP